MNPGTMGVSVLAEDGSMDSRDKCVRLVAGPDGKACPGVTTEGQRGVMGERPLG